MKKYLLFTIIAVVFSACGNNDAISSNNLNTNGYDENNLNSNGYDENNSNSNDYTNNLNTKEKMLKGFTYNIYSGDEIEKISSNPQIEIISNLETKETTAKLISGEAAIIRH
jgi:uncharacterized lipoprotein YehR (DUF1307 family)